MVKVYQCFVFETNSVHISQLTNKIKSKIVEKIPK